MPRPTTHINYTRPVAYLTALTNYTKLHYPDGLQVLTALTLKEVVPRFPYLIRIHKHAAVNPEYVALWDFSNRLGAKVRVVADGKSELLAISRRRIKEIKSQLNALQPQQK